MHIQITKENINHYRNLVNNEVTRITWKVGKLDGSVLKNFPNLIDIDCSCNNLTTLSGIEECSKLQELYAPCNELTSLAGIEKCIELKNLYCSNNKLTSLNSIKYNINLETIICSHNQLKSLSGIENLSQLSFLNCCSNNLVTLSAIENLLQIKKFICSNNKLVTLASIKNLLQLEKLHCSKNNLVTLTGIENLSQLEKLDCSKNNLVTITAIENLSQLKNLNCADNKLITLTGIENLSQLEKLRCVDNNLVSLDGIENLHRLRVLYCDNNQITSLNPIVYLRRIEILETSNNPLDVQTIQVQRFLDRIRFNKSSSVYSDQQNVHNTNIQKTVCESIKSLLRDPKPEFNMEIIINSNLNQKVKERLIEYCEDLNVHSTHLLTFQDLLSYVWSRIIRHESKEELFKILEEQIQDSECKCFTGRFNRVLSVLVGFYDDIRIEISDNDRISAIVLNIIEQNKDKSINDQKILIEQALIEAGYDADIIESWTNVFDEL